MSRKKRRQCSPDHSPEEEAKILQDHIGHLGLATVDEYKVWCRQNGLSRSTQKSRQQRERERLIVSRRVADACLAHSQRERRSLEETINQIFEGTLSAADVWQPHLQAIHRGLEVTKKNRRAKLALKRLILHVWRLKGFFDSRPAMPDAGGQSGNTYLDGLCALAFHNGSWLNSVEQWKPRTYNTRRQFASLARHLLAEYPIPSFFDAVWFKGTCKEAQRQQRWFIHVARGRNIRTMDLPIPYTKRMAHHFLQAPGGYSVETALRWGQIHGFGGDARLADAIRGTRLCEDFSHDDFWSTVLRFLIANPMLDTVHVGPIIDYLHNQRFVRQNVFVAPGVMEQRPPEQPNLCMKGRTPEALLCQMRRWHRQLAHETTANVQWVKSGIGELEFTEGSKQSANMKRWTIRELLSGKALLAEGRAMRHCVASYAGSCARRATSIWTMEVESFAGLFKVLTVEVRLGSKVVCQARGKLNAAPDSKARNILRRWAEQEGLTLARYV